MLPTAITSKFPQMEKTNTNIRKVSIKASDLRGILEYVPIYRDQTFVIAIDGAIIAGPNFANVVTDIAVLRSLGINVVLVHGIGRQLVEGARERGIKISDVHGENPVDDATLSLSRKIAGFVAQAIADTFSTRDLRCVLANVVRATEVGIISGVNYLNAGKTEKIDFKALSDLLSLGMVPVLTPIAVNRRGRIFRINSDALASEVAEGLRATKLIYLTSSASILVDNPNPKAFPVEELRGLIENSPELLKPELLSKCRNALKALDSTHTRRAHILDGDEFACLLTELFEKVGCGTMIYADEYQKIRRATPDDASAIYHLSMVSARTQNLVYRSFEEIKERIGSYFVYELDSSIIGIVSLLDIGEGVAELASLHVQPFYQGHNVGSLMAEFVEREARKTGFKRLFCLSTKSAPFFTDVCGFEEVSPERLPKERYAKYVESARKSKVFLKNL